MFRRSMLLGLLAAGPVHAAQTDTDRPVSLDQLMATLRSVRRVEARYIEHRTLQVLRAPIETRGTLRFDAPSRLEKTTDPDTTGKTERLTIDGDRLTIDRSMGSTPITFSLRDRPEVGVLVDSIRATLSGDGDALRRTFDVALSGTINEWQLTLKPRDAAQRALLQWMQISGHGDRVTAIDTQDNDGDRSDMSIVELRP